jgi:hypothetical protein
VRGGGFLPAGSLAWRVSGRRKAKGCKVAIAVRLSILFLTSKVRKKRIMAFSSWVKGGKSAGRLHFVRVRFLDALRSPLQIVMFPVNGTNYSG